MKVTANNDKFEDVYIDKYNNLYYSENEIFHLKIKENYNSSINLINDFFCSILKLNDNEKEIISYIIKYGKNTINKRILLKDIVLIYDKSYKTYERAILSLIYKNVIRRTDKQNILKLNEDYEFILDKKLYNSKVIVINITTNINDENLND